MQNEIIVAGFGGQGVLFAGQLLAYAAMDEDKQVTWFPSYGPEMRGGTANCTVVIGDEEIGSPVVSNPTVVIAMNLPSMDKYEDTIKTGGLLLANQSMINHEPTRSDIRIALVPCNDIAEELGNPRLANMVMLGAMLANTDILPVESIEKSLREHLPKRHHHLIEHNLKALKRGAEYIAK
jgi:2-oxoglutarate ferredoxin oxidoreductase subunit gamma